MESTPQLSKAMSIFGNFGIKLLNINGHKISLNSRQIEHIYGFHSEIKEYLKNNYYHELRP
jgi:hypothetical protein